MIVCFIQFLLNVSVVVVAFYQILAVSADATMGILAAVEAYFVLQIDLLVPTLNKICCIRGRNFAEVDRDLREGIIDRGIYSADNRFLLRRASLWRTFLETISGRDEPFDMARDAVYTFFQERQDTAVERENYIRSRKNKFKLFVAIVELFADAFEANRKMKATSLNKKGSKVRVIRVTPSGTLTPAGEKDESKVTPT